MNAVLHVKVELLSDTIWGSGYSVPGGEDIAVCQDERGYPYMKGSTLKGLLRESMENWCAWTGEGSAEDLLGESDWNGIAEDHRLHFTNLVQTNPPKDVEECFEERTFTSLENGVVEGGSLRSAVCIRSGQIFEGDICCHPDDIPFLQKCLKGIKWAGTMRGRGFGRIRISAEPADAEKSGGRSLRYGNCIHYRIHTEQPVLITDLSRSGGNGYETKGFIPGAAVRGMVLNALAAREPEQFAKHKAALLLESTRFTDAVPNLERLPALPSVRGFYEDKNEENLENVVVRKGELSVPGLKRAKLGSFCSLEGNTISCWSASVGSTGRLNRNVGHSEDNSLPFQTRHLNAGQDFDGYILLDDAALAPLLARAFMPTIFLGADRYAGFGKCSVQALEITDEPDWMRAYGYQPQEETGSELYMLAVSPLTMLDDSGTPCGLDLRQLAEKLGVSSVEIICCGTTLAEYGGYNRSWGCRVPAALMYDRGSLFRLKCGAPPKLEKLRAIQRTGLGIRLAEGFGQVLFLPPERLEAIRYKKLLKPDDTFAKSAAHTREMRRARYSWVMREAETTFRKFKLSKSQVGTIQAICEDLMSEETPDTSVLKEHLKKNRNGRGALHGEKFEHISKYIMKVLEQPLAETLQTAGVPEEEDTLRAKLELLCLLFNFSRKSEKKEEPKNTERKEAM